MSASEEKTEKPTPKKVKESRKEGQVARTQELGGWAALLLATVAFPAAFRWEIAALDDLMTRALRTLDDPTAEEALELLGVGSLHSFVVLVNPTHVAVALRYQPERGAPVVVARGAGVIAARIREVAAEHDVPLVRDVPLARALHASTEVGQEIPAELFAAVAHVLAFVISRRTRGARGGTHRSPRVEAELPAVPAIGRRRRRTPAPVPT